MVSATLAGVIGAGLVLGIVHVLTGPDHLSALATLSVGKTYRAAFGLGVRWGCGHSFGLLIVAIIFFAVGQSVNIDTLTYYADMFVGFFMITLGVWYIYKAWKDKIQMESTNVLFEEAQMINDKNDNYNTNNSNNNHHATSISLETIDMTDKNIDNNNRNNSPNNGNNSSYQTDLNVSNSNKTDKNITNNNKNTKNNKNNTETEDDSSNHSNSSDTTTTASTNTSNSSNNSNETHDSEVENNTNDENEQKTKSKTQTTKSKSNNDTNNSNNIDEEEDDPSLKERTPSTLDTAEHNDNSNNNTPDTADIGSGDAIIGGLGTDIKHVLSDLVTDDDIEMEIGLGYNEETKRSKCMTRLAAFIAGIFHGIAGPGGVLGVMVALKLSSWIWSSLYMFIFFVSSILTMGVYAIAYGYATSRMTLVAENKQLCAFFLKIISACFSIIVGVLWLALTFTGTLDKIFD